MGSLVHDPISYEDLDDILLPLVLLPSPTGRVRHSGCCRCRRLRSSRRGCFWAGLFHHFLYRLWLGLGRFGWDSSPARERPCWESWILGQNDGLASFLTAHPSSFEVIEIAANAPLDTSSFEGVREATLDCLEVRVVGPVLFGDPFPINTQRQGAEHAAGRSSRVLLLPIART